MPVETDQEARIRQHRHATQGFEKAKEQERQERAAAARRRDAIWKNICFEHPELRRLPLAATPTRSATVDRKAGTAPWAVREMFGDGRAEWYRVDGSESGARDLAERLRKTSQGRVEAMQMGGGRTGRGVTR
jgi:hypothetical protein